MANFIDFKIGGWKIGNIEETAGVFAGENVQIGWRLSAKTNQPSRAVTGDYNIVMGAQNKIEDPDILDTWVQKAPPEAGRTMRHWMARHAGKPSL